MTQSRVVNPSSDSHAPIRTCIATKQRCADSQLLRVVAGHTHDGVTSVVPDPGRRMPGRGAWITPTLTAWEIAHKRRAFGRALKVSAHVDANPVKRYIEELSTDNVSSRENPGVPQNRNKENRKT
nr:YlxR family protein [Corynebacterium lactis]